MSDLTPMQMLEIECKKLLAECVSLRQERDEARAENMAIRVRVTRAHEAVYRAMSLPAQKALAALQDEGAIHQAIHEIFCGPEGTAAYPLDEALRVHLDELGKRSLVAENKHNELREAARALLTALPFETAVCLKHRGHELATKVMRFEPPYAGSYFVCDECAPVGANDLRLAAPVRRLRALVEVKP